MDDASAPDGCIAERISTFAPVTVLDHVQLADSLFSDGAGEHVPFQLQLFLDSIKKQFMDFTKTMQVRTVYHGKYFFL